MELEDDDGKKIIIAEPAIIDIVDFDKVVVFLKNALTYEQYQTLKNEYQLDLHKLT